MAVYTYINKNDLKVFLSNYNIGNLKNYKGILEGVENTNYKIETSKSKYILTIFEKRVNKKDLPFFIKLQNHFCHKNFLCPKPIKNKKGIYINTIKKKSCVIMSFLKGKKLIKVSKKHCYQVGKQLAIMHQHGKSFSDIRKNTLDQNNWGNLFKKIKKGQNTSYKKLFNNIKSELEFLDKYWPKKLPKGVIHADLFQDNIFFINNVFAGVIDFYFACNDLYSYELAICINAWCFEDKFKLNYNKLSALINGYESARKLTLKEINGMPILLRGAAMRFLLSRLHDAIYHEKNAFVKPKDPKEYFKILQFHQNNTNILDNYINDN